MTKKKATCHYELLCLLNDKNKNQDKYEKMISDVESLVGKENVKVEERPDLKPVRKIDGLSLGTYVLINFTTERKIIPELEKNVLSSISIKEFLKLYILLNLTTESKKTNKTKLKEKNAEQS